MNLRKMFSWKTPIADTAVVAVPSTAITDSDTPPPQSLQDVVSNVVNLPAPDSLNSSNSLDAQLTLPSVAKASPARGLLDAPELKAFFANNHFGLGRHNGSNFRTQDALELGKQGLLSKFQNTLAELEAQKQAKVDRLQDKLLETGGVCDITTGRLRQACSTLEREMSTLREQFDSAGQGKGWVLEALNRYQIGFGKGLREAVEFELLAD